MYKKVILYSFLGIALFAGGVFTMWKLIPHYPTVLCDQKCQNAVTPDHRFFSDELFLLGETAPGQPFLFTINLNRKRVGESYSHYYFADFIHEGRQRQLYTDFLDINDQVLPHDFLTSYKQQIAEDLSARESYEFDFSFRDLTVHADLKNFQGDFLVKNTLEYTKYISEGNGIVTINGKQYPVRAIVSKIYTPYYDKYVFFNGYDDLRSLAQLFVLWDSDGNFYLLDQSKVDQNLPEYKSHTWALYKNRTGNYTKKAFSANVEYSHQNWKPKSWSVYVPDFGTTLKLEPKTFFTQKQDSGLAAGTVTLEGGQTKQISGYFSFTRYGQ
jgi:hypothetical protein